MPLAIRKAIPIEQLRQTLEFQGLTPKQQLLVESYIASGGDKLFATQSAYQNKTQEFARQNSYFYFANARVKAVLNLWLGKTERELLIEAVEDQIRHAEKGSVAMQRLLSQLATLKFGVPSEAKEPEVAAPASAERERDARIPADAQKIWLDADDKIVGYRAADGTDVKLWAI